MSELELDERVLGRRVAEDACREAWEELSRRYLAPLEVYAGRIGVPDEDRGDAAHDTLIRAYERRTLYDPAHSYLSWLRTILFRLVTDSRRKTTRRRRAIAAAGAEVVAEFTTGDRDVDPLEALERAHQVQSLVQALEDLSGADADLLRAWAGGASTGALAEARGITKEALRWRLLRARRQLQAHLVAIDHRGATE